MRHALALALLVAAPGAALAPLACGGTKSTSFGEAPPSGTTAPSATVGASDAGADTAPAFAFGGDSGTLVLGPDRDAAETVTSVCTAGLYKGQFMTLVGAGDDGGSPGLFSIMWNGGLSIDLKAKTITITTGSSNSESFGTDTSLLEISDGGALEGGDMYGGSFYAALDGELDCDPDAGPPYHLTATLGSGKYQSLFFNLPIEGHLTADYQAGNPPMLTNGQLLVYADDAGLLSNTSAGGTWTATWVSP